MTAAKYLTSLRGTHITIDLFNFITKSYNLTPAVTVVRTLSVYCFIKILNGLNIIVIPIVNIVKTR